MLVCYAAFKLLKSLPPARLSFFTLLLAMVVQSKKTTAAKSKAAPPAAAKSVATTPAKDNSQKRPAEEEASGTPAKEAKYSDSALKSQCRHFFGRRASGQTKKTTTEERKEAEEACTTYDRLDEQDKLQFAKAFCSNKHSKSFGFVKEYTEKVLASKKVCEKLEENYFTRISNTFCRKIIMRNLLINCPNSENALSVSTMRLHLHVEHLTESILGMGIHESYFNTMHIHLRTGILVLHDLKIQDFETKEEAFAAADKLVEFQRSMISGVEEQHPDIIVGDPRLDQFWYAKHQGIRGMVGG
jgi:hypothetical protein